MLMTKVDCLECLVGDFLDQRWINAERYKKNDKIKKKIKILRD